MANSAISLQKVKEFCYSQVNDEEKWALNKVCASYAYADDGNLKFLFLIKKLLRSVGLFAGSIILMRNFGDLMAI